MKKFIQTLKNIWSIEELRNKILFTLLLIFIYRVGSFIVLPGIEKNPFAGRGLTRVNVGTDADVAITLDGGFTWHFN